MASYIPAGLRSADISRFLVRAAQLEKIKPIVSYWCNYWAVDEILRRRLHTIDAECTTFTTNLMDKLEQVKTENATNDAINDDDAAQAYIEQFALETFQRADNAIRANKASRQTADTFQAAATFLELLNIWEAVDPEITAKIKYAKFHALRIAKAIKAGEDPNAPNPAPEAAEELAPMSYPNDAEMQGINGRHQQASVEDVPDEHDRLQHSLARTSSLDQSLHPSRASSVPREPGIRAPSVAPLGYSVGGPPSQHSIAFENPSLEDRKNSTGGGYFPSVPTYSSQSPSNQLPPAPQYNFPPAQQQSMASPQDFYTQPPATSFPPDPPMRPMIPPIPDRGNYRRDDLSMANAQKHAKWAISALNFEDVNTAVNEFRIALESLGAR